VLNCLSGVIRQYSLKNNSHPGYYFFHEDFVKLKMLGVMLPKSAMGNIAVKMNY
jgi:hypothetical protein